MEHVILLISLRKNLKKFSSERGNVMKYIYEEPIMEIASFEVEIITTSTDEWGSGNETDLTGFN